MRSLITSITNRVICGIRRSRRVVTVLQNEARGVLRAHSLFLRHACQTADGYLCWARVARRVKPALVGVVCAEPAATLPMSLARSAGSRQARHLLPQMPHACVGLD